MSDLVIPPGRDFASRRVPAGKRRPVRFGLATRVLLLNSVFVIAAAMLVYLPAITAKRDSWLRNRLSAAYTAALVLDAAPHAMIPPELEQQLLASVGARLIVLNKHGTKQILAAAELPESVNEVYDFRNPPFLPLPDATGTLTAPPGRVITILGDAPGGGESIAVTLDEAPLAREIRAFSLRLLAVTFFMSLTVAILATLAIHFMVLRPVRRLTDNLKDFAANPESTSRRGTPPPAGGHEIAHAEAELAIMQDSLARELNEKKHLAALGLAVAKINHDMRNMLTSAQLLSDRLANLDDPLAQRLAPKLVATLDRAIRFCQATLAYGQAVDDPPNPAPFPLRGLVEEVVEMVRPGEQCEIAFVTLIAEDFEVVADREQMFRVLMNLVRNSAEALDNMAGAQGSLKQIAVSARRAGKNAIIEVEDTGPGVPQAAREKLFTPFNSGRSGGSGLGLVIALDLVRGHGGDIELLTGPDSREGWTLFRITLPQPADLSQ